MSKTDRATPRPWMAAGTVEIGPGTCRPRIYGPTERIAGDVVDQLICVCDSQGLYHSAATSDEMDVEARANAALIVRAVNSHDALVAACRIAETAMGYGSPTPDNGYYGAQQWAEAIQFIRDALARGEVQP